MTDTKRGAAILVSDFLLAGAEQATTARELCELLGVNPRELTKQIERERRAGSPICASCGANPGYYLAASKHELQAYCGSLRRRIEEVRETLQACQQTLHNLPEDEVDNG